MFTAFAGLGGTAAIIPALLPGLVSAGDEKFLAAVPALFGGLLVGVITSAFALTTVDPLRLVGIGAAIQALMLGSAVASQSNAGAFVVASAGAGVGFGLTEAAGSVAAKRSAPGATPRALNALTATVAAAAALSPLVVFSTPGDGRLGLLVVIFVHAAAAILAFTARRPHAKHEVAYSQGALESSSSRIPVSGRHLATVAALGAAIALYVGVETIFAGGSAIIPARLLGLDATTAALGTSVFWLLMALGRSLAAVVLRRLAPHYLAGTTAAIAATALGVAALSAESAPVAAVAMCCVAVIVIAPTYSLIIGIAVDLLPPGATARAIGPLVACGALGGVLVPTAALGVAEPGAPGGAFALAAALCVPIGGITVHLARRARAQLPARVTCSSGEDGRPAAQ